MNWPLTIRGLRYHPNYRTVNILATKVSLHLKTAFRVLGAVIVRMVSVSERWFLLGDELFMSPVRQTDCYSASWSITLGYQPEPHKSLL